MKSIWTGFRISGLAGLLFGIAFAVFMVVTGYPESIRGPAVIIVPIVSGLVSGLAGATGSYLDDVLEKRGVANAGMRRLISFMIVTLATFGLALAVIVRLGIIEIQKQAIWGVLLGLGFGGAFAAGEYYLWRIRQRVLALEIENKYLSEMAEKDAALAKATSDLMLAEERNRVARDLHDSVSSGIHGIVYSLHSLKQAISSDGPDARTRTIEIIDLLDKTARSTQDELRAMILELKPALLDEKGLEEALRMHCDLFSQRKDIPVSLSCRLATKKRSDDSFEDGFKDGFKDGSEITSRGISRDISEDSLKVTSRDGFRNVSEDGSGGTSKLSADQQVAVYRIVQEALANVEQHSGARNVVVSLAPEGAKYVLHIKDDGSGFDPTTVSSGLGLRSMEQRAMQNGGTLRVISSPGKGTVVEAVFEPVA